MADLFIHPSTKLLLENFVREPAHAVLLSGESGVGLRTLALYTAESLTEPSHIMTVSSEEGKSGISITAIRELYAHTKTKHDKPLVVIIDEADSMKPTL